MDTPNELVEMMQLIKKHLDLVQIIFNNDFDFNLKREKK